MHSRELSCIGYHEFEIGIGYYPDDAIRSITVTCNDRQLQYTEDVEQSTMPYQLPAHYRNHPKAVDEVWNQVYDFTVKATD